MFRKKEQKSTSQIILRCLEDQSEEIGTDRGVNYIDMGSKISKDPWNS